MPEYLDAFIEQCPGYGWQGGPEFKTRIVEMKNGRENRNADWAFARHRFSTRFNNILPEPYRNIKQMHMVARGRLRNFKFRDELDFEATNEVFGEGDGTTTTFQLRKISVIDGVSYIRNTYVVIGAVVATVNGTPASVTVDSDRGEVTFAVAPADGAVLRGTWMFGVWVRFDQDYLPFSLDDFQAVNGTIDLIEMPPPEPAV
jgi:uncharacterized protein (TIGR02217 family)